jgi:acetyl-CoA carboxylase biotin carboxyl carrier protein
MDIAKIRELVELVAESGIAELEIEDDNFSLRICGHAGAAAAPVMAAPAALPAAPVPGPAAEPVVTPAADPSLREVRSPIVGTFYRAPEPGSAPFVDVGQRVAAGDVLCIVEAMKVLNEIEAEFGGVVKEVCLEDGQPVEAEGVLFRIDPS